LGGPSRIAGRDDLKHHGPSFAKLLPAGRHQQS
jgi:hypothetical protein